MLNHYSWLNKYSLRGLLLLHAIYEFYCNDEIAFRRNALYVIKSARRIMNKAI